MKNSLKFLLLSLVGIAALTSITYSYTFNNYKDHVRTGLTSGPIRSHNKYGNGWYGCSDYSSSGDPIWDKEVSGVSNEYRCGALLGQNNNHFMTPMMIKVGNVYDVFYYFYWSEKEQSANKYLVRLKTINIPKNGVLQFLRFGQSKNYDQFLPNKFGYTLIDTSKEGKVDLMTNAGGKDFFGFYMTMQGSDFIVFDVLKGRKYIWHSPFDVQYERIRGGYDIPELIKTVAPDLVYKAEYSTTQGENIFDQPYGLSQNVNDLGQELFLGVTLGQLLESKLVEEGGGSVFIGSGSTTGDGYDQSLAEYNQCVGYWQNVKTYATYDRGCYRGLLDSAPLTGSYDTQTLLSDRKKIKERNGSGELELGDEVACLRFAERKKSYKQKYAQKWENFQKDADDHWLAPHNLVINDICGTFLKIPPKKEEENIDDLLKNNQFIGGVGDYIAGMFRGYGEGSGYNYLEKMEYYRERTVCTLFGWVNQEFCSKLEDPNTKNRYIKKDQDDKIDNSSGFGFFLRKIKTEFDKGKSFLQVNKCTNIGFGKERDMLLYIPMVYLILYLLRFLNNGK